MCVAQEARILDVACWARRMGGTAELGDERRTNRLVRLFQGLATHPVGSLPLRLPKHDLKATYRLCALEKVTHRAITQAIQRGTLSLIDETPGDILLLHDTTELNFFMRFSLHEQLGPVGTGTGRGYLCHSSVAFTAAGQMLGVVQQILHRRVPVPKGETYGAKRDRQSRESRLWLQGVEGLPDDPRLIDVCDRGADTFEFLEHELRSGRRFVIRAGQNRRCYAGHHGQTATKVFDHLRQQTPLGTRAIPLRRKKNRPAQQVELQVSVAAIQLRPPSKRKGCHGQQPLKLWCVRLWNDKVKLERFLYVKHPVTTLEEAIQAAQWYERRWGQEDWHKGLKTGCGVQHLQFTSVERLEPMIVILSAVAGWLLQVRDAGRTADAAIRPAAEIVPAEVLETLHVWRHPEKPLPADWSIRDFTLALGRLGGHQNRRSDGMPGWITLWRGYERLACMLDFRQALRKAGRKKDVG
jgi:hypothetical protein